VRFAGGPAEVSHNDVHTDTAPVPLALFSILRVVIRTPLQVVQVTGTA
jgi:hypothetical protein